MSAGWVCKEKGHRHVVTARYCNYSAFNGYRRTPSDYSEVRCVETQKHWRTKADYVRLLPDARPLGMVWR